MGGGGGGEEIVLASPQVKKFFTLTSAQWHRNCKCKKGINIVFMYWLSNLIKVLPNLTFFRNHLIILQIFWHVLYPKETNF